MKKVILAVAVLFSVALVSCGSDKKGNDSSVAVDTQIEDTNAPVDTITPDTLGGDTLNK